MWLYIKYYKKKNGIESIPTSKLSYATILFTLLGLFISMNVLIIAIVNSDLSRSPNFFKLIVFVPIFPMGGLVLLVVREKEFTFPLMHRTLVVLFPFLNDPTNQVHPEDDPGIFMGPIESDPGIFMGPIESDPGISMGPLEFTPDISMGPLEDPQSISMGPLEVALGISMGPLDDPQGISMGPLEVALGISMGPLEDPQGISMGPLDDAEGISMGHPKAEKEASFSRGAPKKDPGIRGPLEERLGTFMGQIRNIPSPLNSKKTEGTEGVTLANCGIYFGPDYCYI